jgi:rubredoxin
MPPELMEEPYDCDKCGETYDEASGDGYCGDDAS